VDRNRGFALLDALFASALVVAGVLALLQVITMAARANETARRLTVGSILAAQKLEELRSLEWRVPDGGVDTVGEFRREWTVSSLPVGAAHTAVIDVRVTRSGLAGAVRFVTLRARDGP
jgi:Tfp pilus assembly protein PilV